MGYYLAKMVGGNSALLVEINNDNFRRLQYMTRIKCARVLNLSMIRCFLLTEKNSWNKNKGNSQIRKMYVNLQSYVKQENLFINFAYMQKIDNNMQSLIEELEKLSNKYKEYEENKEKKEEIIQIINRIIAIIEDEELKPQINFIERL